MELLNNFYKSEKIENEEENDNNENDDTESERPFKKSRKDIGFDVYSKIPLPAIIGTKEFIEDDYVGLFMEGIFFKKKKTKKVPVEEDDEEEEENEENEIKEIILNKEADNNQEVRKNEFIILNIKF